MNNDLIARGAARYWARVNRNPPPSHDAAPAVDGETHEQQASREIENGRLKYQARHGRGVRQGGDAA